MNIRITRERKYRKCSRIISTVVEIRIMLKAQVRDLYYNSSNLYPNYIIRHILTMWTDHLPGMCRWSIRLALKWIRHIEEYVFRIGLIHVYYEMNFYYLLLFIIDILLLDSLGLNSCTLG